MFKQNFRNILPAMLLASLALSHVMARSESVLRIATTLADVPQTTGQPNQGGEGQRFIGNSLYDGLVAWDLSKADTAAVLKPGLAESWTVDEATKTKWTFKLRDGVKFHDGSAFNAEAVIWNLEKLLNKNSAQFDQAQVTQSATYIAPIKSYRVIDNSTVEIETKSPDAVLPYQLTFIYFSSPAQWEAVGRDWGKFAQKPSGTGPWILDKMVPRERAELVKNKDYWDKKRIPKSDRLVLFTMPDPTTRVAALLSGKVDWVEAPPPDTVPRLKKAGMEIVTNLYPHVWPWQLSTLEDSPFKDINVRKAANLAIDREGLSQFLGGLAVPAKGMVNVGHPWFGKPTFEIKYDPKQAKKLLAESGYSTSNPVKVKIAISPSGSGQMQPLSMNEFIQENLKEVGIDVQFEVMEWESLRGRRRAGAAAPENKGIHGINNSWAYWDPDIGLLGPSWSLMKPPAGFNWGYFNHPQSDELASKAKVEFDKTKQDALLAQLHAYIVDQAMWLWVVHDMNPRAMSPKVKGYVQAQSWFQDLSPVYVQ